MRLGSPQRPRSDSLALKRPALVALGTLLAAFGYGGLVMGDVAHGGVARGSVSVAIRVGDPVVPAAMAGAVLALGLCLGLAAVSRG